MKTRLKVILTVAVALVAVLVMNFGFRLLNTPDDVAVAMGVALLSGLFLVGPCVCKFIW